MKRVLIIEAQMKQYRLPFYAGLYETLRAKGIKLTVAYSDPSGHELRKCDNRDLPIEYGLRVKSLWLLKKRILYQPLVREINAADLVITNHAFRLALTQYLLLLSRLGLKRVAFWGHGNNRRGNTSGFLQQYKKRTLNWVTWWFAYTSGTSEYLQSQGVPKSKITVVQNSVDTHAIREHVQEINAEVRAIVRAAIGISPAAPVGIFVGTLQKVKSIPFLLEASKLVRDRINDFHLLIVGGGPDEGEIKESARDLPWVHFLGPKFGAEKSALLAIADVFLLPGSVGLAILDAFAAGLPLVTTRLSTHCPELEYLEEESNGLMSAHDPDLYAEALIRLLAHPGELATLREGALRSAQKYSVESMVENFSTGILRCMGQSPKPLRTASAANQKSLHRDTRKESDEKVCVFRTSAIQQNTNALLRVPAIMPGHQVESMSLMTTSWDDGHPLDFRVAELLEKYSLPGTFYVPRTSERSVMAPSDIRQLGRKFEIGAHTLEHVRIDRLRDTEASQQLSGSRQWIEEITGKRCDVFCFPKGKVKSRQLGLVRAAGFRAARTVELLSIAEPRRVSGLCLIPTTIQVFPHGMYAYTKNAAKRFSTSHFVSLPAALQSNGWVGLANEMLTKAIQSKGVFHLWGHSWEIDELDQWENLEQFLMTISQRRESLKSVTNSQLCSYAD